MSPVSINPTSNAEIIAKARKAITNAFERLRANGFKGSSKLERIPHTDTFVPAEVRTDIEKAANMQHNGTLRINKSKNPMTKEQTEVWNYTGSTTDIPRVSAAQYDKNGNLVEVISCSAEEPELLARIKNKTVGEELDRTDMLHQYRYNDVNQRTGETSIEVMKVLDTPFTTKTNIERYPNSGRKKLEEVWVGNANHSKVEYAENGNQISKVVERSLDTSYPSKTTEIFDEKSGKLLKRSIEDRYVKQSGQDLIERAECEFDAQTGKMTKRSSTYLSRNGGPELPKTLEEFNSDGTYKKITVWDVMQKEPVSIYEFNHETNQTIITYNNQGKTSTIECPFIIFGDILKQKEAFRSEVGMIDISILEKLK